ncbi:MAG: Holliday junction branch migration protein RuvA [Dehalococcoidales bacterium]|jgi:Holliday junction DNA helicase RuvA|nr:Holliday junction branch migration protein RuvA [Dehalococcoidales bacterium]
MIASLQGKVEALGSDWVVVNVSGIGFRVYAPTSTLSTLGAIGTQIKLHTYLHLREDNVTLCGFTTGEELGLFQNLLSVSGIGPRLALAMLSAMNPETLTAAIVSGSVDILTEIPGIGKKTANRLILELKDKLSTIMVTAAAIQISEENTEVIAALTSLGYSLAEANRAVSSLPPASGLALEEKVKRALQYFTTK